MIIKVALAAVLLAWGAPVRAGSLHELAGVPDKLDEIRRALEAGADPNVMDDEEQTPLGIAARAGLPEVCEVLIRGGADVNGRGYAGRTPLIFLAANFQWADEEGLPERLVTTAELLIRHGAIVDAFDRLGGWTPLVLAAANGHVKLVETLLDRGADVNLAMPNGHRALHQASARGKLSTVKLLLDRGADPSLTSLDGSTALDFAQSYEHHEIVRILRSRAAE